MTEAKATEARLQSTALPVVSEHQGRSHTFGCQRVAAYSRTGANVLAPSAWRDGQ